LQTKALIGKQQLLVDTTQQARGLHAEAARHPYDGRQARLTDCALEQRDLGAVHVARFAQGLLREAGVLARAAEIASEDLVRLQGGNGGPLPTADLQTKRCIVVCLDEIGASPASELRAATALDPRFAAGASHPRAAAIAALECQLSPSRANISY
jgi:hypothetical protein